MRKNVKISYLVTFILLFIIPMVVFADNLSTEEILTGEGAIRAARIIGNLISILKWVVPLLIIVIGMVDFGKAVVSNDENAIKKAGQSLIKRFIAGLIVFMIPTLVYSLLIAFHVGDLEEMDKTSWGTLMRCVLKVSDCPSIPNDK